MIPIFFFISGFCSILYQIVWLRLAMGYFGVIAPVLSTVLSVFMLGLGLGAWAVGRWLVTPRRKRWPAAHFLALYGLWEGLAAFGSLTVPILFAAFNSRLAGNMDSQGYFLGSALAIAGTLFIPCVALGATTPTALAYARAMGWDMPRGFSWVYFANILGALSSALLTPFVLIELLGFQKTLSLGMFMQALVSSAALAASLRAPKTPPKPAPLEAAVPALGGLSRAAARLALGALFLTGFVSLAGEVIWTRLFTRVLGTTIYAFAGVLAVYLAMHALGVAVYRRFGKSAASMVSYWLLALLPFAAMLPLFLNDSRWPLSPYRALGSLALFCALLGWLTPGWVDAYCLGDPRRAGRAYGINVLGCVLGPLVAAYLLLPHLGVQGGLTVLAVLLYGLAVWAWRRRPVRQAAIVFCFGAACLLAGRAARSLEVPLSRAVVRRDYAATVISAGEGRHKALFVNGINLTALTPITKMMAHLPVLAHTGTPRSALVICFGMGTTFRSLLSWNLKTTAVELVPSVRDAFGYYFSDAPLVLSRPEGRIIIDDGRRYLKRTGEVYDIITLDPPPPVESAASGFLYSREFYDEIKRHLAPGGVVQQWWPGGERQILQSVARTFFEAFPYVRVYKGLGNVGFHFLGSRLPLRPLGKGQMQTIPLAAQKDMLEWFPGKKPDEIWEIVLKAEIPPMLLVNRKIPALTDDRPFNEYFLLRRRQERKNGTYFDAY